MREKDVQCHPLSVNNGWDDPFQRFLNGGRIRSHVPHNNFAVTCACCLTVVNNRFNTKGQLTDKKGTRWVPCCTSHPRRITSEPCTLRRIFHIYHPQK